MPVCKLRNTILSARFRLEWGPKLYKLCGSLLKNGTKPYLSNLCLTIILLKKTLLCNLTEICNSSCFGIHVSGFFSLYSKCFLSMFLVQMLIYRIICSSVKGNTRQDELSARNNGWTEEVWAPSRLDRPAARSWPWGELRKQSTHGHMKTVLERSLL